ncbi:hypothetical protein BsWGS_06401 [Bradybaena similaris]
MHMEQWLDSSDYSYCRRSTPLEIGVTELPARNSSSVKQAVFGAEFIAFSPSKSEDEDGGEEGNNTEPLVLASSVEDKNKIVELGSTVIGFLNEKFKNNDAKKQTVVSSLDSDILKSPSIVKFHKDGTSSTESSKNTEKSQEKSPVIEYKIDVSKCKLNSIAKDLRGVNKSHADGGKHERIINQEPVESKPKVKKLIKDNDAKLKEKEFCLPFTITKASKKQKDTETECDSITEPIEIQPVSTGKKKATTSLARLESFLELPKSGTEPSFKQRKKKRVALSKTDAAVKPRTPKFFLRRPPATVVKYRQDSDTNTDYSDSEASVGSSPVKRKRATSKDASLLHNFVSEDTKPGNKNTARSMTASVTQDKSGTFVLDDHKVSPSGQVVRHKLGRVTPSSHDESMSSEQEDGSVTDEDTGEQNELPDGIDVDNGSEDGGSQKSTTETDTDSSTSEEEFVAENMPGLEFNLDRGAAGFAVKNPDSWKINEKDRLSIPSTSNRYFFPRPVQCRNCRVEGHLSRDCPKPLKRRCAFCGVAGHSYQACPEAICFNCFAPGHKVHECREKKMHWAIKCERCWMPGHEEQKCPDRWRQYHITTNRKELKTAAKDVQNPLVFCYNCGKNSHLGHECRLPRMNKFTNASYPFIARYDNKNKRKESHKSWKQHSNDVKNERSHRDKWQHLKDRKNKRHIQENEDEYTPRTKKRKRSSKKWTEEHWSLRNRGGSNDINRPGGQAHAAKSGTATLRRKEIEGGEILDGIFNDFGKHQVNDNEWWNRNGKPAKKRRKKNFNTFPSDFMDDFCNADDDWQRGRAEDRKQLIYQETSNFQRSHTHRLDAKGHGQEWKKNKRPQRGPGKSRHEDFTPEFQFYQQDSKTYENRRLNNNRDYEIDDFISLGHSQDYKLPFNNKTSKKSRGRRAGFQKPDSSFAPRQGGFQVRNDRFVAMKRNHNKTVNFRK